MSEEIGASERILAWAAWGELPEAAVEGVAVASGDLVRALSEDPADAEALAGLRALGSLHEQASAEGGARIETTLRGATRDARQDLLEDEDRAPYARFALGLSLALSGTGLEAVVTPQEDEGAPSLEELVSTLSKDEEGEPGAGRLGEELGLLVSGLRGVTADRTLGRLGRAVSLARSEGAGPARPAVRFAFEQALQSVRSVDDLRRLGLAFAPFLTEELAGHPIARLLTGLQEARERGVGGEDEEVSFLEQLLARLDAGELPPLSRVIGLDSRLQEDLEERLQRRAAAPGWADKAERFADRLGGDSFRFDRRFGLLDTLLDESESPLGSDRGSLGAVLGSGLVGEMVLPATGGDGASLMGGMFSGFGGMGGMGGMGFGEFGGLSGLSGFGGPSPGGLRLDPALMTYGGPGAMPALLQGLAGGGLPPQLARALGAGGGGLGALMARGNLSPQMLQLLSGAKAPGGGAGGLGALLGNLSPAALRSFARAGSPAARPFGGLDMGLFSRGPAGFRGGMPSGLMQALMPFARAGQLPPGLMRAFPSFQRSQSLPSAFGAPAVGSSMRLMQAIAPLMRSGSLPMDVMRALAPLSAGLSGSSFGALPTFGGFGRMPSFPQGARALESLRLPPALLCSLGLPGLSFGAPSFSGGSFGGAPHQGAAALLRSTSHLLLGMRGGQLPTGFSSAFNVPNALRGSLAIPGLARASFNQQAFSPSLRGLTGGLPAWSLPPALRMLANTGGGPLRMPSNWRMPAFQSGALGGALPGFSSGALFSAGLPSFGRFPSLGGLPGLRGPSGAGAFAGAPAGFMGSPLANLLRLPGGASAFNQLPAGLRASLRLPGGLGVSGGGGSWSVPSLGFSGLGGLPGLGALGALPGGRATSYGALRFPGFGGMGGFGGPGAGAGFALSRALLPGMGPMPRFGSFPSFSLPGGGFRQAGLPAGMPGGALGLPGFALRGPMHALRLDGFGRPHLTRGPSAFSHLPGGLGFAHANQRFDLSGLGFGGLGSGRGFGTAGPLTFAGVGGLAAYRPGAQFFQGGRFGRPGVGGRGLQGAFPALPGFGGGSQATAFGMDMRLGQRSLQLFPGAGMRWQAMPFAGQGQQGLGARVGGRLPTLFQPSGYFASAGAGLPLGYSFGFQTGFTGFGAGGFPTLPALAQGGPAALAPSMSTLRLGRSRPGFSFAGVHGAAAGFSEPFSNTTESAWASLLSPGRISFSVGRGLGPLAMPQQAPQKAPAWGSAGFSLPPVSLPAGFEAGGAIDFGGMLGLGGFRLPGRGLGLGVGSGGFGRLGRFSLPGRRPSVGSPGVGFDIGSFAAAFGLPAAALGSPSASFGLPSLSWGGALPGAPATFVRSGGQGLPGLGGGALARRSSSSFGVSDVSLAGARLPSLHGAAPALRGAPGSLPRAQRLAFRPEQAGRYGRSQFQAGQLQAGRIDLSGLTQLLAGQGSFGLPVANMAPSFLDLGSLASIAPQQQPRPSSPSFAGMPGLSGFDLGSLKGLFAGAALPSSFGGAFGAPRFGPTRLDSPATRAMSMPWSPGLTLPGVSMPRAAAAGSALSPALLAGLARWTPQGAGGQVSFQAQAGSLSPGLGQGGALETTLARPYHSRMAPGADLSRHLMGQTVPFRSGAMQLAAYDPSAALRTGDQGLVRPGGWRGLAAHSFGRPALGLRDAEGLSQRGQLGAGASFLDLASGLESTPRLVPGLARNPGLERSLGLQEARPSSGLGGLDYRRLASSQLDAASPVFTYETQSKGTSERSPGYTPLTRADLGLVAPLPGERQQPKGGALSRVLGGLTSAPRGLTGAPRGLTGTPRSLAGGEGAPSLIGSTERAEPALLRALERSQVRAEPSISPRRGLQSWGGSSGSPLQLLDAAQGGRQSPMGRSRLAGLAGLGGLGVGSAPLGAAGLGGEPVMGAPSVGGSLAFRPRLGGRQGGPGSLARATGQMAGRMGPRQRALGGPSGGAGTFVGRGGPAGFAPLGFVSPSGGGLPQGASPSMTQVRPASFTPPAPATHSPGAPSAPPRPEMTHTNLVAGTAGGGVLRRASADVDPGGDTGQTGMAQGDSGVDSGHVASPPQDLSVLVNQLYAEIKRELIIERERRGGIY